MLSTECCGLFHADFDPVSVSAGLAKLLSLGAERLLEMGIGDDRDEEKWETGFLKWLPKLWLTLKAPEPEDDGRPKDPLFEVKYHDMAAVHTSPIVPPGAQLLSVAENKRMTPAGYERDIRHVALSKDGVDFPFDLGDAVAIYPENLPQAPGPDDPWHFARFGRHVVANMLDLFGRPSRSFCADLARFANNAEAKALRKLSRSVGPDEFPHQDEWVALSEQCPTYFDLMKKFSSAKMPLEQLLSVLPLIKPRIFGTKECIKHFKALLYKIIELTVTYLHCIYSIASDARYSPKAVEFTIVINQWKAKATGELKTGTCTKFIQQMPLDKQADLKWIEAIVACAVVCGTFQFPEKDTTPMVMVGLGTGIAPIRSFMQEMQFQELRFQQMFEQEGVLTKLVGAFQFDKPHYPPKQIFVSDKMAEQPELISDNLLEEGGYFFMCGPAVATPSVQKALKAALVQRGGQGAPKTGPESDKWHKKGEAKCRPLAWSNMSMI
eukprot:s487_g20.t1